MTTVCPEGHLSDSTDFCDICGSPLVIVPPPPPPPPPAPPPPAPLPAAPFPPAAESGAPGAGFCGNCGAPRETGALFCEDCGYDFTTGQLPPPAPEFDPISGQLTAPPAPAPPAPATLIGVAWVAEVWVDADWFAVQETGGSCPTSGAPTIYPLRGPQALIGRRSSSRKLAPEVDCTSDGAISHSHAELALAGGHWSVRDLGSTNGTYVGRPGSALPTDPLTPRELHELADDERIYLGAWTRIVVREATATERGA